MKTQKGILYLEFNEYVPSIVSESCYKLQNYRKNIRTAGRGGNGNPVLIEWESIPAKYQLKFKKHQCLGKCQHCEIDEETKREKNPNACDFNVYEEALETPLKKCLTTDYKAEQYYIGFRFENGSSLKPEQIESYTTAISWLNLLQDLSVKTALIKQELNLSIGQFWECIGKIIERDNVQLPSSYKRLRMKLNEYEQHGYDVMISDKFGNNNTAKIKDNLSKSVLLEMLAHPHQFDDVYIQQEYNKWAKQNFYKTIDVAILIVFHIH